MSQKFLLPFTISIPKHPFDLQPNSRRAQKNIMFLYDEKGHQAANIIIININQISNTVPHSK
jgi:hypothetical protein